MVGVHSDEPSCMGRRSCEWVRAHVRLNSLHTPGYVDYFLVYPDTAVKIIDNFLVKIWLCMAVCMAVCGWLEMAAGRMHMLHLIKIRLSARVAV